MPFPKLPAALKLSSSHFGRLKVCKCHDAALKERTRRNPVRKLFLSLIGPFRVPGWWMLNLRLVTRRVHSNVKELADGIVKGDRSSLARAITLGKTGRGEGTPRLSRIVESKLPEDSKTAQDLFKQLGGAGSRKETMRIGISGSPGVGKSSLIEKLGMFCIEREGWRVATLVRELEGIGWL